MAVTKTGEVELLANIEDAINSILELVEQIDEINPSVLDDTTVDQIRDELDLALASAAVSVSVKNKIPLQSIEAVVYVLYADEFTGLSEAVGKKVYNNFLKINKELVEKQEDFIIEVK